MNWMIPITVSGESGIYSTLKENHKRGGNCSFRFITFFGVNPHLGTDPEKLRILVNAANKFHNLVRIEE